MKRYPLPELVKRWEREELTIEQAIGQILLWLTSLAAQVEQPEATQQTRELPKSSQAVSGK